MSRLISRVVAFSAAVSLALVYSALAVEIISVPLEPDLDQFGEQIFTVQAYGAGSQQVLDVGIYDTGASVITFSAWCDGSIPIKVADGASGSGIGGVVIGDVSHPGPVIADGLQAVFNPSLTVTLNPQTAVPNVQAFVGTQEKSPALPALTGMPIHKPTEPGGLFPGGSAAHISMRGEFDLGLGVPLTMPRLDLKAPGTALTAKAGSTAPARIALTPYGDDNYGSEGGTITSATNPTFANVTLKNTPASGPEKTVTGQRLLFDTGAQVSIISRDTATALGLDLDAPSTVIEVQGAAGTPLTIPGFTIGGVQLPAAVAGTLPEDFVHFTNVPIYVYDLQIPGLDGILGMNVFNTADELMIDPINGQLSVTFIENRLAEPGLDDELERELVGSVFAALLGGNRAAFAGHIAPAVGLGPTVAVPEPATVVLLLFAAVAALAWRRR